MSTTYLDILLVCFIAVSDRIGLPDVDGHASDKSNDLNRTLALTCFLEQISPFEFTRIIGLPVHCDTIQSVLEGFPRAGVYHAGLRLVRQDSSIWGVC